MSQTTYFPKFSFLLWIKRCKEPPCSRSPGLECRGLWRFLTGVLVPAHDGKGSGMFQTTYVPKCSFLHWIKKCKEPACPRSPGLGFWRTLEVPNWGFGSWSWWGWVYNVPNYLCSEIQLSTLNKKVQRTLMSLKFWTGVLKDPGGSWLGFWFLIMMGRGQECPKQPMFQNSAFYIE